MRGRAALIVAFAAAAPAVPARAQDVARLPLGSNVRDLVGAADGSAWVVYNPAEGPGRLGRISTDGQFRSAKTGTLDGGEAGLDGHAWFTTAAHRLVRADGDLRVTRSRFPRRFIGPFAIGSDGTLWTPAYDGRMAHISAEGRVSYSPASLPPCTTPGTEQSELAAMARAADSAMWIADFGCDALLRVTSAGTASWPVEVTSATLFAAGVGGSMWFTHGDQTHVGHVDATGAMREYALDLGEATDMAAGPDGSAWLAHGRCQLSRIDATGRVTTIRAPIVAQRLAVDGVDRLLLAGPTRLVRFVPGQPAAACDRRGPAVRAGFGLRVSLGALRRGLRLAIGERAAIQVSAVHYDRPNAQPRFDDDEGLSRRTSQATTLRYRISATQLRRYARRLTAGDHPRLELTVVARDADGNEGELRRMIRVTR